MVDCGISAGWTVHCWGRAAGELTGVVPGLGFVRVLVLKNNSCRMSVTWVDYKSILRYCNEFLGTTWNTETT